MAKTTRMLTAGLVAMVVMGANRPAAAQNPTVTLQVRNDAHVDADVLAQAEAAVTDIYAKAGVTAVWTNHAQLMVVIVPRARAEQLNHIPEAMGFAPGSETARGHIAYVLDHKVDDVAQGYRTNKAVVLGVAMAHEVGHLLLFNAHSKTGLMRPDWNQADFRNAAQGQLLFTAEQGTQIRTGMAND
jgi:hypothetical protein